MKNPLVLKDKARDEAYTYFDEYIRPLVKTSAGSIDPSAMGLQDNDVDAFRHAYVSAIFTQEYGETAAEILGQLNEIFSFGDSLGVEHRGSTNMDLWNNSVGRGYGKDASSSRDLLKRIHKALKDGELITDPADGRRYGKSPGEDRPNREIIVLKEDENGRNTIFFDTKRLRILAVEEFISAIKNGEYPRYFVRIVAGEPTPVSRADGKTGNNLG